MKVSHAFWGGYCCHTFQPGMRWPWWPCQVTNCWLVLYTWLQHTDVDIPHYDKAVADTDMAEHDTQQNYEIYEAAMVFSGCHMWWFPIYVHMWWFQRDSHPFIACDHFFEGASGVIMAVASWRIPPRLMTPEAIDGRFILLMSYIIYHHVTSHKNLSIDHWIPLEASFMTVSLTFFPPWHRSGELDLGEGRIPHSGPALWPLGDVDAMWCRCHVVPVMPFFMFVDELGMGQYL